MENASSYQMEAFQIGASILISSSSEFNLDFNPCRFSLIKNEYFFVYLFAGGFTYLILFPAKGSHSKKLLNKGVSNLQLETNKQLKHMA